MPKYTVTVGYYDGYRRATVVVEAGSARTAMMEAIRRVDAGEVEAIPHMIDPSPTWVDAITAHDDAAAAESGVPHDLGEDARTGGEAMGLIRRLVEIWDRYEDDGPVPLDDLIAKARKLLGPAT